MRRRFHLGRQHPTRHRSNRRENLTLFRIQRPSLPTPSQTIPILQAHLLWISSLERPKFSVSVILCSGNATNILLSSSWTVSGPSLISGNFCRCWSNGSGNNERPKNWRTSFLHQLHGTRKLHDLQRRPLRSLCSSLTSGYPLTHEIQ